MNKFFYSLCTAALIAGCTATNSPSDDSVVELYKNLNSVLEKFTTPKEVVEQQVCQIIDSLGIDINAMNVSQFEMSKAYRHFFFRSDSLKNRFVKRLNKLAEQKDINGAKATILATYYYPKGEAEKYSYNVINHPAFLQVVTDSANCDEAISAALIFSSETDISPVVGELGRKITPLIGSMSNNAFQKSVIVFRTWLSDAEPDAKALEAMRLALIERNNKFKAEGQELGDGSMISYGNDYEAMLNSAIAKGELIGYNAPEINFIWSSDGKAKKLSDYKGKIVVVDFWATWCGPCVRSFPNIRKLQERYKGFDVVIVGVTSIQGRHIRRFENGITEPIDTKGKPEEEFKLMKEFMSSADMTWPVVFSESSCFDKNFGVYGIPHVAIIDAEGKVRYNGLRPYEAPFHEAAKIDELLKEAGKKAPSTPMSEENFAK